MAGSGGGDGDVAIFIGRYEFIIGVQLVPMMKGTWVHGLISYTPSLTDWMLTLVSVSIAMAGWAVGAGRMAGLAYNPYLALARIVEQAAEAGAETAAGSEYVLDGNYPLAGKTVKIQIEVLDVQPFAGENCSSASSCVSQCSGQFMT